MSITNYFGKPRTKYVPYKSPYTFEHLTNSYPSVNNIALCIEDLYLTFKDAPRGNDIKKISHHSNPDDIQLIINEYQKMTAFTNHYGVFIQSKKINPLGIMCSLIGRNDKYLVSSKFALTNLDEIFNKILDTLITYIEMPFWKIVKILPTISIYELLILKQSDTDKHVVHLEKMVASLCEDNLSLNNRIKALEQRFEHQSHIPLAEPIAEHITVAEAILKW